MPMETFSIAKSHGTLTWLAKIAGSRRVPQEICQELSNITTTKLAEAFVQSAGIRIITQSRGHSQTIVAAKAAPPEYLEKKALPKLKFEYHGPKIVFTRKEHKGVAFGTALLNILLPEIKDRSEAEENFKGYKNFVLALSRRLEALPFLCITGHKISDPPHDLFLRGFRFFFSPEPDELYEIIRNRLELDCKWQNTVGKEQKDWLIKFQDSARGHQLLDDAQLQSYNTTLVDLR